jgi:hypothetical protein
MGRPNRAEAIDLIVTACDRVTTAWPEPGERRLMLVR